MHKNYTVFNAEMELFGLRYISKVAPVPAGPEFTMEAQRKKLLSIFYEQLLLFDNVAIKLERTNFGLYFLIKELGIDQVETLITRGTIRLLLWTPLIVTSVGRRREDGTTDESVVTGTPPLVTGNYVESDSDPEKNIETALNYFNLSRERRRQFIRAVRDKYLFPNKKFAGEATAVIIDAYEKNRLQGLGLPFEKAPNDLTVKERSLLQKLGHDVLDISVLSEMDFKSYNKYPILNITESALKKIESALKVSENTSAILDIENVPDIASLVLDGTLPFNSVFHVRHKSVVKHYRKWINEVSAKDDALPISKAYIDEITGKNKFFESKKGKLVRNIGVFAIGGGIEVAISGLATAVAGVVIGKAADFGLGLFDTYVLDGLLKGWNPQMFVDEIRKQKDNK